jgi:hypothetical protein
MALVTSFEQKTTERHTVHGKTRCLVSSSNDELGETYLQLDTVGSADRGTPDKVNQSFQIDRKMAGQLRGVLHHTFPGLVIAESSPVS